MPNNKRHHFVPQFYLRRFSSDEKSIDLYNHRIGKVISQAPISKQSYQNYLYGRDNILEKYLDEHTERPASEALSAVERATTHTQVSTDEWISILLFLTVQIERTVKRLLWVKNIHNVVRPHYDDMWQGIDKSREIDEETLIQKSVERAIRTYPYVSDLAAIKLVTNQKAQFITSDSPVVLNNEYAADVAGVTTTAYAMPGLQIILPIGKHMALMLYDQTTYSRLHSKKFILRVSDCTVSEVNKLSIENSHQNLYLGRDFDQSQIARLLSGAKSETAQVNYRRGLESVEAGSREYLQAHQQDRSRCLQIQQTSRVYRRCQKRGTDLSASHRNTTLCDDGKAFQDAIKNGKYEKEKFNLYLADKYGSYPQYKTVWSP